MKRNGPMLTLATCLPLLAGCSPTWTASFPATTEATAYQDDDGAALLPNLPGKAAAAWLREHDPEFLDRQNKINLIAVCRFGLGSAELRARAAPLCRRAAE